MQPKLLNKPNFPDVKRTNPSGLVLILKRLHHCAGDDSHLVDLVGVAVTQKKITQPKVALRLVDFTAFF